MVQYKCDKCNKLFDKKSNFLYHINRKIPCFDQSSLIQNESEKSKKECKRYTASNNDKAYSDLVERNELQCQDCDKIFSSKSNLNRHLNGRCKEINNNNENEKTQIFEKLLREVEELKERNKQIEEKNNQIEKTNHKLLKEVTKLKSCKKSPNNINSNNTNTANIGQINNNNINNNNINIKLVAFKKEDVSFITDDVYKKILNKGFKSVPSLVEYIHFNNEQPQNTNVYISNMRDKYALVYDGNNWQLRDRETIMKELIDDKTQILSLKFDEMIKDLDEFTIRKFSRFLDESDDNEVVSQIKDDLRLVLYNNRKMIEADRLIAHDDNELLTPHIKTT